MPANSPDWEALAKMPKVIAAMSELKIRKNLMRSKDYKALKSTAILCEESAPVLEAAMTLLPVMTMAEAMGSPDDQADVVTSMIDVVDKVMERQREQLDSDELKDSVS